MVLRMICFVGLIMLVQSIGFFVEGENGVRHDNASQLPEKPASQCIRQLHPDSDSSPLKNRCTFYAHSKNSLMFYHKFNETIGELKVEFFRGIKKTSSICKGLFNATQLPFDCNNFSVIPSRSHVTFHLWSLNGNDTDIYFFCMEVMYPPPYIKKCDEGTIIHVKEPKEVQKEVIEYQKLPLSLLIILGCIAAYSLIITTSFLYMLRNRRRMRIQQSEYINVVPRRPKNHKPYIPYATNPGHPCIR